jgi:hypothetical protein
MMLNQRTILQHVNQVFIFLQNNIEEGHIYLLCRHRRDQGTENMGLFLYELDHQNDANCLAFIPVWMLNIFRIIIIIIK